MDFISKIFSFLEKFVPAALVAYANSQKTKADKEKQIAEKAILQIRSEKAVEVIREDFRKNSSVDTVRKFLRGKGKS